MTKSGIHRKHIGSGRMAAALAVSFSLLLTACAGESTEGGNGLSEEGNAPASAQKGEWVYVPEVITVEDEHADYERMQLIGDTFCYVSQGGDAGEGAKCICRYSLTDRELKSASIDWSEGGDNWDAGVWSFDRDGNVYLTANVYPADYSSMKRFMCKFDPEGCCLFSRDITEQTKEVSLGRLTVDGQGRIYIFASDSEEILLYTAEGEYHGAVSFGSSDSPLPAEVKGVCESAGGKYYVCISRGGAEDAGYTEPRCSLAEIDFEGVRLLTAVGNLPDIRGICAGGGYDVLMYDHRAVFGFDFDSLKSEELFAWMNSDVNGYFVTNLYPSEDGRLFATVSDWGNDDRSIVALEKCRAEQAPLREELVLATVNGGSDLAAMAIKFNRGSSRYHLTVQGYESLTDLYNALLTKKTMDLIDLSGINVQKLVARGALEDLTPYVEQSQTLGRPDFVEGILEAYTFSNTLAGIPTAFTVRTVVGDGRKPENAAGLTLEALLRTEGNSGARTFDGMTREEMMQYIMMFNEDTFIDWKSGVCHFASETFREVLEYVKRFPDSVEGEGDEDSLPARIRNGEVMYVMAEFDELRAFQVFEGMFGENAACVGFPTPDGRGGHLLLTGDAYGIAAVSEHKEGAWEFMEEFLTREKSESYYGNIFSYSFPTLKKVLNEKVEEAIERDSRYDSKVFPEVIYSDGTTFQFHALTWDEVNVMLNLIPDARPYFSAESDEIIKIINEEAWGYYSGQREAEDTAGTIQNRVQLYINENR